jgi:hypothetical protein
MSSQNMVLIRFAYMRCLWDRLGNTFIMFIVHIYIKKINCPWAPPVCTKSQHKCNYKDVHYDFNIFELIYLLSKMNRDSKTWSTGGIEGVRHFLGRTWRLIVGPSLPDGSFRDGTVTTDHVPTLEQLRVLHRCIAKVSLS